MSPRKILERTKLPHVAYFSFGEKLAVLNQGVSDPESLGYALNSVCRLIESQMADATAVALGVSSPSRGDSKPVIMGGVPTPTLHFTGREQTIQALKAALNPAGQETAPHTLLGLSGVGKTQLAIEFARRFQADYGLIWWIQSDEDFSLRRSFVSLARRLGLPESDNMAYTVSTVLEELGRGRPTSNWLLIYDGAGEPEQLREYLPSGPGHVLITSRSQSWAAHSQVTVTEVDVFTRDESLRFLHRRWSGIRADNAGR